MKYPRPIRITGLLLAFSIVIAACSGGDEPAAESPGEPIPAVTFETFAGEQASLGAYAGEPLVVNFWASWCPSCVAEMSAAFVPAQELLGDQVAFLGMNIQDERARALDLVEETGVLFDLAEDPIGALYTALGGLGMPFTVFISPDGRVLDVHNGPLTEDQLVDRITEVLLS
jgi:thiol-disulfide isomerase/thioredoxin